MVVQKSVTKKSEVISELEAGFKSAVGIYITDFSRVRVETVTTLRATLKKKGMKMKVAKNTLIKRALDGAGIKGLEKHLVGPTAVIMSDDQDPMAPAKALVEFYKTNEGFMSVKVVSIDGATYPGSQIATLAKMPGKRELQASIITLALGPGAQVAGIIKGPGAKVAGQIKALVEKLEGGAQ